MSHFLAISIKCVGRLHDSLTLLRTYGQRPLWVKTTLRWIAINVNVQQMRLQHDITAESQLLKYTTNKKFARRIHFHFNHGLDVFELVFLTPKGGLWCDTCIIFSILNYTTGKYLKEGEERGFGAICVRSIITMKFQHTFGNAGPLQISNVFAVKCVSKIVFFWRLLHVISLTARTTLD